MKGYELGTSWKRVSKWLSLTSSSYPGWLKILPQVKNMGKDDNFEWDNFETFHGNFEGSISKARLFQNGYFEFNFENGCLHYVHWELELVTLIKRLIR